jgi:hypothetical protein
MDGWMHPRHRSTDEDEPRWRRKRRLINIHKRRGGYRTTVESDKRVLGGELQRNWANSI